MQIHLGFFSLPPQGLRLKFRKPSPQTSGFYTQDFLLSLPDGQTPFLSTAPDYMLIPRNRK